MRRIERTSQDCKRHAFAANEATGAGRVLIAHRARTATTLALGDGNR